MISKEEYIKDCWEKSYKFITDARKHPDKYNEEIKLSIKRFKEFRKIYLWDISQVERVFKFFRLLNIKTRKNKYETFILSPWQAFFIINVFGFYVDEYERLTKEVFVFLGRKNGKTTFSTAIMLYMLVADGELNPEILLFAKTNKQAFETAYVKALLPLVENSPYLSKLVRLKYREMEYVKKFETGGKSRGILKTLGSDDNKLDGYNPSSIILDEIHSYPDNSVYSVCTSAFGGRTNYLLVMISTAGFTKSGFINEVYEMSRNVLRGKAKEDSLFILLFTLDEGDDPKDTNNWYKSNPGLLDGVLDLEYLKREFNKTLNIPSLKNGFLSKHLNVFTDDCSEFIEDELLLKAFEKIEWERFSGMECYAGLDLSAVNDITALSLLFYDASEDIFYNKNIFLRADNEMNSIRKNGLDLKPWVYQGFCIQSTHSTIDYDSVMNIIIENSNRYNIKLLGYDAWNAPMIVSKIKQMGINTQSIPQGLKYFNGSIKFLIELFAKNKIKIDNNPMMIWMFRNVIIQYYGNDMQYNKNKQKDSIDGVVALTMALSCYINLNIDSEYLSLEAYNNSGIFS